MLHGNTQVGDHTDKDHGVVYLATKDRAEMIALMIIFKKGTVQDSYNYNVAVHSMII